MLPNYFITSLCAFEFLSKFRFKNLSPIFDPILQLNISNRDILILAKNKIPLLFLGYLKLNGKSTH